MQMMKIHYQDTQARSMIKQTLNKIFGDCREEPVFICIGTGRHILDCMGPLTGTIINTLCPDLLVYGTLDKPIHATNIYREINRIRTEHSDIIEIAIDASIGNSLDLGVINIRKGSLTPGKAFSKNLPQLGHYSITGVVDSRESQKANRGNNGEGLVHVYHIAKLIGDAISEWHSSC